MENIKTKRRLVTSALPYVNNIPHLGNLIQVLSADVFARFCRSRGYETLYICGTDEYGTATETRALEEGVTPRQLCDYYYEQHDKIYRWFGIAFDKFGRTSNEECTEITQSFFRDLDKNGYIKEHTTTQLYCPKCDMALADRYVRGTCPKCGYEDARGDQCERCGALLNPTDLISPRCAVCSSTPVARETKHLYLDLPAISASLSEWMKDASARGRWADNAVKITEAWLRDGLTERAITRDLKWGIPVPREGYERKVFYVWFNAPIGYISITAELANELRTAGLPSFDWKSWWLPAESEEARDKGPVELFQFIGKDNIPFHTVIFPSSEIGTGRPYTKLFHMSSSEYLNYEDGKFSKSRGVGVFGTDAVESGIPADAWRFFIFYNRPEKADYQFTWREFRERYNGELIGNLANLVNRTLIFIRKYFDSKIPNDAPIDEALWAQVTAQEARVTELLEWAEIKDAFRTIFAISDLGNKAFQQEEPWKLRVTNRAKCASLLRTLCYMIKDLMIMAHPYMPQFTETVMRYLGGTIWEGRFNEDRTPTGFCWRDLGKTEGLNEVLNAKIFFKPLDEREAAAFKLKFSGQRESHTAQNTPREETRGTGSGARALPPEEQIAFFRENIELRVAKIIKVEKNSASDKLYVETLDDGSGAPRVIQSGLREYMTSDELFGKNIILVSNLESRRLRGIESRGMLLAVDYKDEDGSDKVEVLEAPWAKPGDAVVIEGAAGAPEKKKEITAEEFSRVAISVAGKKVLLGGRALLAGGRALETSKASEGAVH